MGSSEKHFFGGGGEGERGNRLIASEKIIKVYLLWPFQYRLNKYKVAVKKNAPLQDSVRGYIREISVAMFFKSRQIYIHIYCLVSYFLIGICLR